MGTFKQDVGHSLPAVKFFLSTPVFSKWENPSSFPCSPPSPHPSISTTSHPHHSPWHPPQHPSAAVTPDPPPCWALNHQQPHSRHSRYTAVVLVLPQRANMQQFWICPSLNEAPANLRLAKFWKGYLLLRLFPIATITSIAVMREQLQHRSPPLWLDQEVHGQAGKKKKNPSLITLVYLQRAVGELEYFLSTSPVQETQ